MPTKNPNRPQKIQIFIKTSGKKISDQWGICRTSFSQIRILPQSRGGPDPESKRSVIKDKLKLKGKGGRKGQNGKKGNAKGKGAGSPSHRLRY